VPDVGRVTIARKKGFSAKEREGPLWSVNKVKALKRGMKLETWNLKGREGMSSNSPEKKAFSLKNPKKC
jgi:hypothetical protein